MMLRLNQSQSADLIIQPTSTYSCKLSKGKPFLLTGVL